MAEELYNKHCKDLNLCVEPDKVMFLRTDSKKKAFAYCKLVMDEYTLLTDKKFFIVIVDKYFDKLKTKEQKAYVLLHEMKHLWINDNDQYKLLDHNLKEFGELLQNPSWNLLLVQGMSSGMGDASDTNEEGKIGLDFDFNSKEDMKAFKENNKQTSEELEKEDTE